MGRASQLSLNIKAPPWEPDPRSSQLRICPSTQPGHDPVGTRTHGGGAIESDARLQGLDSRSAKRKAVVRASSVSIEKESGHSGHIVGVRCVMHERAGRGWVWPVRLPAFLPSCLPVCLCIYITRRRISIMFGLHVELETVRAVTEVGTTGIGGLRLTLDARTGARPSNARLRHYVCPSIHPSPRRLIGAQPAMHASLPSPWARSEPRARSRLIAAPAPSGNPPPCCGVPCATRSGGGWGKVFCVDGACKSSDSVASPCPFSLLLRFDGPLISSAAVVPSPPWGLGLARDQESPR